MTASKRVRITFVALCVLIGIACAPTAHAENAFWRLPFIDKNESVVKEVYRLNSGEIVIAYWFRTPESTNFVLYALQRRQILREITRKGQSLEFVDDEFNKMKADGHVRLAPANELLGVEFSNGEYIKTRSFAAKPCHFLADIYDFRDKRGLIRRMMFVKRYPAPLDLTQSNCEPREAPIFRKLETVFFQFYDIAETGVLAINHNGPEVFLFSDGWVVPNEARKNFAFVEERVMNDLTNRIFTQNFRDDKIDWLKAQDDLIQELFR